MADDNLDLARNIMRLRILSSNACESFEKQMNKKNLLTTKVRILFLIDEYKSVSPTFLIDRLYVAKSNIALFCKQLLLEGLITSSQDLIDKRIIYYCLTPKGKEFLKSKLSFIQDNLDSAVDTDTKKKLNESMSFVNKVLSKKF
jgi:DNA-binding MarR family transcriptional regulator